MSAGHGRGKKRGGHEEEHENHERWAVSYADMMTVLMALFLVLFAMSSVDEDKYESLRTSLAQGFGNEALPRNGGSGVLSGADGAPIPMGAVAPTVVERTSTEVAGPEQGTGAGDELAARVEAARLAEVRDQIQAALDAAGRGDAVQMRITERGLEVVVVSDDVFFANASADLQPGGRQVLDAIAPVVAALPEEVAIEGHTNHLPLTGGGPFTNNRALSAMRAVSVLNHLTDAHQIAAARLSSVGYAETRPLLAVGDPKAIEVNRRVDIVVLSAAAPQVKALLPTLAGGAPAAEAQPAVDHAAPAPADHATEEHH
jgi:chemotaxis protein MotB